MPSAIQWHVQIIQEILKQKRWCVGENEHLLTRAGVLDFEETKEEDAMCWQAGLNHHNGFLHLSNCDSCIAGGPHLIRFKPVFEFDRFIDYQVWYFSVQS